MDTQDTPTVDPVGRLLGIELTAAGDGEAALAMTVRPDMLNGHETCHGGIIFLLGDMAMDYAVNTGNPLSVGVHAETDFVRAAQAGDRLIASAQVKEKWGRTRLIDATVTNDDTGETVAIFRGRTRQIGK